MEIKDGNLDHEIMVKTIRSKRLDPQKYFIHYEPQTYHINAGELFLAMSAFFVVATPKK